MFELEWTPAFMKAARRFSKQHPELKEKTSTALLALEKNPFQPSLKLHSLSGNMKGLHAIRITYSYRVTLVLKISKHVITLLDIGDYDDVIDNVPV